jgi:hypothetical protein
MGLIGFELTCKCCNQIFFICKSHYRGHRYCSELCRKAGYQESRKKAREEYEQKRKAKQLNAKRQAAYRERQNSNTLTYIQNSGPSNKVTDQSSLLNKKILNPLLHNVPQATDRKRCSVCREEICILVRIHEKRRET